MMDVAPQGLAMPSMGGLGLLLLLAPLMGGVGLLLLLLLALLEDLVRSSAVGSCLGPHDGGLC